ncbi:hypothetical protein FACS189419_01710 [Planctomycetales bacterium]|nr:hypothetical protein FACS189419_01710 [Planctomycetales bacterium]
MNRRNWLQNILGSGVAALTLGATFPAGVEAQIFSSPRRPSNRRRNVPKYPNAHFYKDGKFDVKAATAAYDELFAYFNYSLKNTTKDKRFWVIDFNLGDFANVGMGGIFWVNDKEHGYFGHEIYLLPGQMIVEHSHQPAEDKPAKHEYWQVRHGSICTFAQGGKEGDPVPEGFKIPVSQLEDKAVTAFIPKVLNVGEETPLKALGEWHFMVAGPEGAIVTEYASFHAGQGLKFQNKKASL